MDQREGVEGAGQRGKGVGRAGQCVCVGGALPYVAPVTRRELVLPLHCAPLILASGILRLSLGTFSNPSSPCLWFPTSGSA